jgi:hypothetical protein
LNWQAANAKFESVRERFKWFTKLIQKQVKHIYINKKFQRSNDQKTHRIACMQKGGRRKVENEQTFLNHQKMKVQIDCQQLINSRLNLPNKKAGVR